MSQKHLAQILSSHDLGNLCILHHPQKVHQLNLTTNISTASKRTFDESLNSKSNMILSAIPIDGHALIIPTIANNAQQQQQMLTNQTHQQQPPLLQPQKYTLGGSKINGFRGVTASKTLTNTNINNLLATVGVAKKTKIVSTTSSNNTISSNSNHINNNNKNTMPTTSKYLFVQQNSNGKYTTYEGSATTATPTVNGGTNVGNIVLLATEPLNGNSCDQQHLITTSASSGNDNDEELRSLAWLSDSNLIKGIVTTTGSNGSIVATSCGTNNINAKRNNVCIVNASNAHDLIEEIPHVVNEENVIATAHASDVSGTSQITLSVSDFQQQFITSNKRFTPITITNSKNSSNNHSNIVSNNNTIANITLAHDRVTTPCDNPQKIYNKISAIGATTSVHVGPSGTTTVVEYKATNGNFLPTQHQLINGGSIVSSNNNLETTTITATNLTNNSNTMIVPSTSSSTNNASSTIQKTVMPLQNAATLLTNTNNTTNTTNVHGNRQQQYSYNHHQSAVKTNNTNIIYHEQEKQQHQDSNNNTNLNLSPTATTSISGTTTTHHPHKKYLREKMNVLDHGGGSSSNNNNCNNSGIALALVVSSAPVVISAPLAVSSSAVTVVASPASSLSSQSSSSTSSSTAAVNGGSSPVSKSFFPLGIGNNITTVPVNYASNSPSPSASSPTTLYVTTTSPTTPLAAVGNIPASFTLVNETNQKIVSSSSSILYSSEPQNTKEYYSNDNNSAHLLNQQRYNHQTQHNHHQQQQQSQSQNMQHYSMRSPTSHSSYDNDSLKDFEITSNELTNSSIGTRLCVANTSQHHSNLSYHSQTSVSGKSSAYHGTSSITSQKQKHPNNVPYDPLVHTHNKPPYSFSSLIFMAIEGSQEKALPVKEIYAWIMQHFPYFKTAPTGWKNSVRHNLSLNKSFVKVEKAPNMGKGSLWRVEQQQRPSLIQALNRSPFFPNSTVDKMEFKNCSSANVSHDIKNVVNVGYDVMDGTVSPPSQSSPTPESAVNIKTQINSRFDPQLYPNLAKTFKDMKEPSEAFNNVPDEEYPSDYSTTNHNSKKKYHYDKKVNANNNNNNLSNHNHNSYGTTDEVHFKENDPIIMGVFTNFESMQRLARDCGAENIDDVNAATAMLALKHGPKVFSDSFQNGAPVITNSPSEDHTYSAGGGSAATSGSSTPLINGNSSVTSTIRHRNSNPANETKHNGCDKQSNCASSDAAYESSEESHNVTPKELEDQKRYQDGVDALLSLSLSSIVDSISSSPTKRPAGSSVEEEHLASSLESNSNLSSASPPQPSFGKMSILSNSVTSYSPTRHQYHQSISNSINQINNCNNNNGSMLDEGYNTQSYYGTNNNSSSHHHHYNTQQRHVTILSTPSPLKKVKPLRSLRKKIKCKASWR